MFTASIINHKRNILDFRTPFREAQKFWLTVSVAVFIGPLMKWKCKVLRPRPTRGRVADRIEIHLIEPSFSGCRRRPLLIYEIFCTAFANENPLPIVRFHGPGHAYRIRPFKYPTIWVSRWVSASIFGLWMSWEPSAWLNRQVLEARSLLSS